MVSGRPPFLIRTDQNGRGHPQTPPRQDSFLFWQTLFFASSAAMATHKNLRRTDKQGRPRSRDIPDFPRWISRVHCFVFHRLNQHTTHTQDTVISHTSTNNTVASDPNIAADIDYRPPFCGLLPERNAIQRYSVLPSPTHEIYKTTYYNIVSEIHQAYSIVIATKHVVPDGNVLILAE
jgi:hypothetical protein